MALGKQLKEGVALATEDGVGLPVALGWLQRHPAR
jgi:hypothetical protein